MFVRVYRGGVEYKYMNQEQTQNVFIGLLAAGLILLGVGVYMFSVQLQSIATSVKQVQQGIVQQQAASPVVAAPNQPNQNKIALLNSCLTGGAGYSSLCFDYPSDWFLTSDEDEFMPQNKNVFITSSPGRLLSAESTGGPGQPGVTYFNDGYQMSIQPITLGEPEDYIGPRAAGYTFLYQPLEACNEVGCPNERYFYFYSGPELSYKLIYEIDVNYNGVPSTEIRSNVDTVLRSLSKDQ